MNIRLNLSHFHSIADHLTLSRGDWQHVSSGLHLSNVAVIVAVGMSVSVNLCEPRIKVN